MFTDQFVVRSGSLKMAAGNFVGKIVYSFLSRSNQIENYYFVVGKLTVEGNKII
jgi:hypothetical protein